MDAMQPGNSSDGRLFPSHSASAGQPAIPCLQGLALLLVLLTAFLLSPVDARSDDAAIQQKESELKNAKAKAETVRAAIRNDHPGDSRPAENIIQADIAFEEHFHQKLADAKEKLALFDVLIGTARTADKTLANKNAGDIARMIAEGTVQARDATLSSANQKLAPFFRLDANGNLAIGPAFLGLPAQFPAAGGVSIEGAKSIINKMIDNNAAMKQKRQDQLTALGNELALRAEVDQLKRQQQRRKIIRYWVECSPAEIFQDESSLCVANVAFEDGSFDQYNAKSTWTGSPGGSVRGDSAAPGTTATVTASYLAPAEEGGRSWSGTARVHIKARPPEPAPATPPAPGGAPPGQVPPPAPIKPQPDRDTGNDHLRGGNGDTPPPPPPVPFEAALDCPNSFELVPGDFIGRGCGIIVKGWNSKGGRVEVKVDNPKNSGIDIFPGDTSADASQMHNPGVSDFHARYIFSESIRANETARQGVATVTIAVSQDGNRINLTLRISVLQKGQVPSRTGTRPPVSMATGGGQDAKWCVWRYRSLYEPPACFLFVKAECFKYGLPKYELVGQQMTWMQAEALMGRLSRYGGDAYGCLKAQQDQQNGNGGGGSGGGGGGGGSGGSGGGGGKGDDAGTDDGGGADDGGGTADSGCARDEECPTGYVCQDGQCVEPFDENYADASDILDQRDHQRDEDIIDRNIADQGSGANNGGFSSSDLEKDLEATQDAVSGACNRDSDCPSSQRCKNGKCVGGRQSCSTDADCPHGSACRHGTCTGSGGGKQGLSITPPTKAVEINEPVTFKAMLTAADGTTTDVTQQTTWNPANPFSNGSIGQYTVNATYQSLSGSATVNVVEKKGLDDITVNSKTLTVTFFDHGVEDGDMIDIMINGKTVFAGITLTNAPQSRTFTMQEDVVVFGFRALNEGSQPPNTATVTFSGVIKGKSSQVYELNKNQSTNMNIAYSP